MSPRQVLTIPDVPPTLLTQSAGDARYLTPAAAAAAYLPLTGGTLTGNLLVNPGNTYNLGASGSGLGTSALRRHAETEAVLGVSRSTDRRHLDRIVARGETGERQIDRVLASRPRCPRYRQIPQRVSTPPEQLR